MEKKQHSGLGLKQLLALLLAALMVVSLCSCSTSPALPDGNSNSGNSATEVEHNLRPTFLAAQTDADTIAVTPSVNSYEVAVDFSNVVNFTDVFGDYISDEAKQMLLQNGFFVRGLNSEFFSQYESNRYLYQANFVTVDSMMHTYHLYFTKLLKGVEKDALYAALGEVSDIMLRESATQLEALRGTDWENAAKRNLAFFTVAACLLNPDTEIPSDVAEPVSQELALIEEAAQIADSPVMNLGGSGTDTLQEDYTQYIPRSYYTSSEELTRYFKAMMWYGRLTFRQKDEDQTRSALLITTALENSDAMSSWEEIYTITNFFVGASDDLGVYEYAEAVKSAYAGWPEISKLPDMSGQWSDFCSKIATLQAPVINSIPVDANQHNEEGDALIKGFRFMGQRSTLDAAVFQQLVFQNVGENAAGETRMLPSGLDLTAALGSELSMNILTQTGATDYAGYTENMTAVKNYLAATDASVWSGNLYSGWVNTLRPLTEKKGEGWPQFMQNEAWAAKGLNTFLGSWTELKHDTVLYAKQVYSEMGGAGEEIPILDDRGYVEPEVMVYARLANLAQGTADGLERYGILDAADKEDLGLLVQLATQLQTISQKELAGEVLTDEEYDLIRTYGGQLEHFWSSSLEEDAAALGKDYVDLQDFPAALVTDVATDPNGWVLEEGVAGAATIYVVVEVDGVLKIASGSIYQYYEFTQPMEQRLTDEDWRAIMGFDSTFDEATGTMVDRSGERPELPEWTMVFRPE